MRRVLWLIALLGCLYAIGSTAEPARADVLAGTSTPGCVRDATIFDADVQGVSRQDIRFRIQASGASYVPVLGRWEFSNGALAPLVYLSGPGAIWAQYGSGAAFGPLLIRFDGSLPSSIRVRFHLWVPSQSPVGCFSVDSVTVTRDFFTDPNPVPTGGGFVPPTVAPTSSAGVTPTSSAGPSSSPGYGEGGGSGYCSIYVPPNWEWVPCAILPTATPYVSPSPSPSGTAAPGCPVPFYGSGTFTIPAFIAEGCDVWFGFAGTPGTWAVTWSAIAGGESAGGGYVFGASLCGFSEGGVVGVLPDTGITGNRCTGGNQVEWGYWFGDHSLGTWSIGGGSDGSTLSAGTWASVGLNHGALTGFDISPGSWTLTVSYTGTWEAGSAVPTPTPTVSPSASAGPTSSAEAWCADNPDSLVCITLPPDWGATPNPSGALPPGAGTPDVPGNAVASLVADLQGRSPFGELGQISSALSGALSDAAGSDIDWCFSMPLWSPVGSTASEVCIPFGTFAAAAAFVRPILLVMFALGFGVVVLRRVTENT